MTALKFGGGDSGTGIGWDVRYVGVETFVPLHSQLRVFGFARVSTSIISPERC